MSLEGDGVPEVDCISGDDRIPEVYKVGESEVPIESSLIRSIQKIKFLKLIVFPK